MKKIKDKKNKIFARENGSLLILIGVLFLVLTFILNVKGNISSYLRTRISENQAVSPGDIIGWEALMAITLSVSLIMAGMIMFFASKKNAK